MLRARNEFELHRKGGARPNFLKIDLSIIFTPQTIHPEEKDDESFVNTLGINPNRIMLNASDMYCKDTMGLLGAFLNSVYPLACGD